MNRLRIGSGNISTTQLFEHDERDRKTSWIEEAVELRQAVLIGCGRLGTVSLVKPFGSGGQEELTAGNKILIVTRDTKIFLGVLSED
jgi:hypothetical protein